MLKIDYKIPTTIIHSQNKVMHPVQDIFEIHDIEKSTKIGELVCHKTTNVTRPDYKGPILAIDYIKVTTPNNGLGTAIIKFARNLSMQMGCKGHLVLKADSSITKTRIPHIFYRKLGFSSLDKKTDRQMDKFIKRNKSATPKDFPCLIMHFPAPKHNPSKIRTLYKTIIKNSYRLKRNFF